MVAIRQKAKNFSKKIHRTAPMMFLHELVKNPSAIGAICPSSRKLARRMAASVDIHKPGLIIELGAGTGVMTQALLEHGVSPEHLIVIEFSENFYDHLKARFPTLTILHADAAQLETLLPEHACINSIISSLPLISLPAEVRQAIVGQWQKLLAQQGQVVQFTYNLKSRYWQKEIGATNYREHFVWLNLPPAKVMTFSFHS